MRALLVAVLLALPLTFACSGPRQKLEEMNAAEYGLFQRKVAAWAQVISWGLTEEGVLIPEDMADLAKTLSDLAEADLERDITGVLVREFRDAGWQAAALFHALEGADLLLELRGVWSEPGERWRSLLKAAAAAVLEGAAMSDSTRALAGELDAEIEARRLDAEISDVGS